MNASGMYPLGTAVLVKHINKEERKQGVIFIPKSAEDREAILEQRAIVVDIGPLAFASQPPDTRPQIGDMVLIAKYSGHLASSPTDPDGVYRFVNDIEIFAKLDNPTGEQ